MANVKSTVTFGLVTLSVLSLSALLCRPAESRGATLFGNVPDGTPDGAYSLTLKPAGDPAGRLAGTKIVAHVRDGRYSATTEDRVPDGTYSVVDDNGVAAVQYVQLQTSTPGSPQIGHANITGTLLAGKVVTAKLGVGTSSPLGNIGVVRSDGGPGVHVQSNGTALFAKSTSNGAGANAAYFSASASTAKTVFAESTAGTGVNYAGYFQSRSQDSVTLFADNIASGPPNIAIKGRTRNQGVGVWGEAPAGGIGTIGEGTIGVQGSGSAYGVHGIAVGGVGLALYSEGDFAATGNKSFLIDHPQDPENKYLAHYCHEGPEPRNDYYGEGTLDTQGRARVTLPGYYSEINRDPLVFLTAVGRSMPGLYVADTTSTGFQVAGGAPGGRFTWMVSAVRNDRWNREHPVQAERPKPEELRGTYLQPELYGQPASRSESKARASLQPTTRTRP